jgi:hypothetical protein
MQDDQIRELPAQQMIRELGTGKAMTHDWVFVGSATWTHPDTGEELYLGDGGEFICVSNFGGLKWAVARTSETGTTPCV